MRLAGRRKCPWSDTNFRTTESRTVTDITCVRRWMYAALPMQASRRHNSAAMAFKKTAHFSSPLTALCCKRSDCAWHTVARSVLARVLPLPHSYEETGFDNSVESGQSARKPNRNQLHAFYANVYIHPTRRKRARCLGTTTIQANARNWSGLLSHNTRSSLQYLIINAVS